MDVKQIFFLYLNQNNLQQIEYRRRYENPAVFY